MIGLYFCSMHSGKTDETAPPECKLQQDAQLHCDIFCQRAVKMIDGTYNKQFP